MQFLLVTVRLEFFRPWSEPLYLYSFWNFCDFFLVHVKSWNLRCALIGFYIFSRQNKGNPLLKHIRNMRWAFTDVVCGYLLGQNSCALYLRYSTGLIILNDIWNP
ncbi:hypothetical protein AB3S75_012307 [Citrus x aurantiifolia]